ncbi:MAG: ABC transporter ATP-binding protein [bacterium]
MSSEAVISLQHISKRFEIYHKPHHRLLQGLYKHRKQLFEEFWALRDISFDVLNGETVGIIGKNGAGKSTLLQIICGTLAPTSGELNIEGRVAALLELGAGFNPEFSGHDNVYMYAALLGLSKEEIDRKYDDIITFADIGTFLDQPVKTYSSGMFVRLAFAVIAHVDADVLVIDEALAVGDVFFTQKCMRFLRQFQQHGTILFVSHDTSAIVNFCSKAIWIDQGQIKAAGPAKDVTEKYLEGIYEVAQDTAGAKQDAAQNNGAGQAETSSPAPAQQYDQRLPFLQHSKLRNDLEIFAFKEPEKAFGTGEATITDVKLIDPEGRQLTWAVGGENVAVEISCALAKPIHNPIVGFVVKDKLGQTLFGDNSYLSYQVEKQAENQAKNQGSRTRNDVYAQAGDTLVTRFSFAMPILPAGAYSLSVAIAEGTQEEHVQHHWVHDAVTFESHASSLSTGLLGIPMHDISITTR